jgi:hypothetical protein
MLGHSSLLAALTAAYALWTAFAQTPPSFEPATSNHLMVIYGTATINPAGITVPGNGQLVHLSHYDLSLY